MKTILRLLRTEWLLFRKDRTASLLTYAMPVFVIAIIGSVFGIGGSGEGSGPTGPRVAVVNASPDPVAAALVEQLRAETGLRVFTTQPGPDGAEVSLTESAARDLITQNKVRFALVFPVDAIPADGFGLQVRLLHNPRNEVESQIALGLIQKTLYSQAPRLLLESVRAEWRADLDPAAVSALNDRIAAAVAETFALPVEDIRADMDSFSPLADLFPPDPAAVSPGADSAASDTSGAFSAFFEDFLQIETEQLVGAAVKNPMATRVVAGYAVMFMLFSLTAAAGSLFEEKKAGLFFRLLSAPVSRDHILWSKYLFLTSIGVTQLLLCFLTGRLLFGVVIEPYLPALVLMCLVAAASCTAFGMLLASLARTQAQATGLGTLLILVMSSIGGAWWPTSMMPEWIQKFSTLTLVYWSVEGFLQIVWAGAGFLGALPSMGVLLLITGLILALSLWRFRTGDLFR